MKRFFIIAVFILLLLVIAFSIFIITFDANRYKSALIAKLEQSMDKDVRIDDLSLSLLHGLRIEVEGVAIKDRDKTWNDFLLKAKNLNASIKVLPLLKKDIQIERFFIPELEINTGKGSNSPVFRCALVLDARILVNSLSQDDALKTLSAKGNMRLTNAVLDNMNILRTVLDNLSMMPDLVQKLKNNLPEKYSGLLNQNHTAFKPMNADFEIKDGRIYFDKLLVESDIFYLMSRGFIGMIDQSLEIDSNLFIPKDLSGAFTNAVQEFKYLTDNNGLITMPLDIKGRIPNVSIMPDLDYVLQRLIASKGQELLNKFFKNIR